MSYRRKVPFALDIDGKTLIDSDKAYEYMYNRILKCPECNQYVKVVRKHDDENNLTSWYFAHEKVSNYKGTGASSIHEACKQTIENNIGKTIIIPAVRSIDTEAHISSFTTNGKESQKRFIFRIRPEI